MTLLCGDEAEQARKPFMDRLKHSYDAAWLAQACLVRVELENKGKHKVFGDWTAAASSFVLDDGRVVEVDDLGSLELEPGTTGTLTLMAKRPPPAASRSARPWYLALRRSSYAALLPLARTP